MHSYHYRAGCDVVAKGGTTPSQGSLVTKKTLSNLSGKKDLKKWHHLFTAFTRLKSEFRLTSTKLRVSCWSS